MAADTESTELTRGVWVEVTAPLMMADGKSYAVEVVGGNAEAADVNGNASPAADDRGHPWYPGTSSRPADYREFPKKAGCTWWFRAAGDKVFVVATEI